ncbi:MAG: 50S ribosomal protein L19e [Candidatus Bathyarchaeota archaeon]|nr:MAG: 50S ribosomal protein L19e [Candidatus Bathyarchaeota archaeon]
MNLRNKKRLAAKILKVGKNRVWIDSEKIEDVEGVITREEIRKLIHEDVIRALPKKGISRARARNIHDKRKKGLKRGAGSRKGKKTARSSKKTAWANKIRAIRKHLKTLRTRRILQKDAYRKLYVLAKSGVFSDNSDVDQYIEAHKLTRRR